MLEDWTIYSWYCPNCKNEVAGLKNKKNQIRVRCSKCGAEMVRTVVGRRHDVISADCADTICTIPWLRKIKDTKDIKRAAAE